ncbi:hypothetical protein LQ757_11080 [Agromyces sp. SYSU K20354]|uniref:hypothetical protein n=1 Tax=Agromyces cavernae TaxID=2898659 RepID=UPI001E3EF497|nr:hypothetical protein [Agromyces cavernae]MCD2442816.1 hypothetical protein [Agromyces cavernae]
MKLLRYAPKGLRIGLVAFTIVSSAAALSIAVPTGAGAAGSATGFSQPYAGTPKYEKWTPTQAGNIRQVNRPLGQKAADRIARKLGLDKQLVFTPEQYELFIRGEGVDGDPASAALIDESVRIFTNTTGNPLHADVNGTVTPFVLASYGLMVSTSGVLMSLANEDAPTRKVNPLIAPGGYVDTWCKKNGCEQSLAMLHRSAYQSEIIFAIASQQLPQSEPAQLVPNVKSGGRNTIVGMSMAPSIWIINFTLLYVLNPTVAAQMPGWWTPIPPDVAEAIAASPHGQVPYGDFESSFPGVIAQQ